jgi:hypothetical protein
MARLTTAELNSAFIEALGDHVVAHTDLRSEPLELHLKEPYPTRLRAYLFNATNPPGGRPTPEHKIQLMVPGQARQERGNFDYSDGYSVLLAGKVEDREAFILWDASLYRDFSFSANVQVKTATIRQALTAGTVATQHRYLQRGLETVLATPAIMLPQALLMRFPAGVSAPASPPSSSGRPASPSAGSAMGGKPYAAPSRNSQGGDEPKTRVFEIDPDALDRGTTAHKDLQDQLAAAARGRGLDPLSPKVDDPQFDVAWIDDTVAYIIEVKSLTMANEEKQLRLGLGQVLSYIHLLRWPEPEEVRAVLAVERRPSADYWIGLCVEHNVILTWPDEFDGLFISGP